MPQVPVYGDRQVRTEALRPVLQQAPDVSSGARALAQGLGQAADAIDRIDLRDAQAKAEETDVALTKAWDDWENANRSKFTNKNAEGYTKAVDEWWQEAAKTYGAGLDPRSQAMVGKTLARRRTVAYGQAGQYEVAEKKKYRDSTYSAALNTSLVTALKTGDYEGEAARTRDLVAAYGRDNELDKDQRDAERNARMGAFNTAVVAQLAEKDAVKAQEYLNGAIERGEIRPDQQPRLEAVIKKEANDQEGKRIAQSLAALPYGERLKRLSEIDDKDLREAATGHVEQDQQRIDRARTTASRDLLGQAKLAYEKGGKVPAAVMTALEEIDPGAAADLMRGVKADQKARAAEAQGKEIKTDFAAWQDAYDKISAGQPVDLLQYRNAVSRADLMALRKVQEDRNKPDKEKDVATTAQVMNLYTGGYKPEKKTAFNSAFLDEVNKFEREKKRPATYEEKRKIGDRLIIDGEVLSGRFFLNDPNKKYYEATPEERARFAPTITSGDRKLVKDALMAEGIKNPTEAQIVQRFKLAKGFR